MAWKSVDVSELQIERRKFEPVLPDILKNGATSVKPVEGKITQSVADRSKIKEIFKNIYGLPEITFKKGTNNAIAEKAVKVAVVFSGGQAPGGHNVIAGLFDGLKIANSKNTLIGYFGGPSGILENKYKVISEKLLCKYRNTGGFDFIQSGRTKIETSEQFCLTKDNLLMSNVDALVVVGGDDSNTNAAMIAEYLKKEKLDKCVIGVPKTIDGDLKNKYIETSFGFDTATKIYSELVGNICRDVNSAQKYWHFIRLMGRSASHIALEVGFKTQPNIVLVGEEILEKKLRIVKVVENIVDVIVKRSQAGKNFGVVLVPEGLIEFIPEMKKLISTLNDALAENASVVAEINSVAGKKEFICTKLPAKLSDLMKSLPSGIASQLMLDRDPHGNVQVSLIETEKLLIEMVHKKLYELKKENKYGGKFSAITHFFGYEGRCGIPSNFDANYTYALGYNAAVLVLNGLTGYLSSVRNLARSPKQWECGGIPLTMMMNIEKRHGKEKPVIQKALVDLNGKPFKEFVKNRDKWALSESYISPGPIQYFGPADITDMTTRTLKYEQSGLLK
ncbi:pyrophosphate--fructose 6-phosphate 1-phosphotransferase [Endomicrobiia bacterium]|uniref:diphosphate--fructose-6-phosphate 1-phosphotransferase n=1 Tax=Endomicrobium trichonymphae TaxID=1408204 RepID=UPI0008655B69|nr:diphosphate--fructose-6-phosphate 1-phosphotransferase [Candidatus Endomicrobium trichonymphae]BAV59116.1 pyrophosphate-fructose-6-phosphate 1-phosphotransferase [Candidatus Endomicrobium trichonymphae]GHT22804.1 pyrophosphate--fructose 6-phosphate 1-phosphotransferase [Endomicrobiia bacterium]